MRYPLGNAEDTSVPTSFAPAKPQGTQGSKRNSEAKSRHTPHSAHKKPHSEDIPLILDLKEGEGASHADQQANRSIDEGLRHVDQVVGDSSVRITEIPDTEPAGSSDDPPRKSVDKSIRFTEPSDTPQDYWEARGDYVIRVHTVPRSTTFTPLESPDSPVHIDSNRCLPYHYRGFLRGGETTSTEDIWDGTNASEKQFTRSWTGETKFLRFYGNPPPSYEYVGSRLVRKQSTKRPGNIMPEDWIHMGQKAKDKAIREWPELRDKIHKARVTRGLIT